MKKIYHYENLSGAGLVTGRAVRLVRDSDGLEIDCTEIGTTGKYLAEIATPSGYGIYSVFDVTSGSPGVDLDQKVDVFSSQTIAEQITFPGDPAKFLDGNEVFRVPGISDVSGLATALAGKEPSIAAGGNARHAWFGAKAFRAIEIDDLPSGIIPRTKKVAFPCQLENIGSAGGSISVTANLQIIEIIKLKAYAIAVSIVSGDLPDLSFSPNFSAKITPSYVSGDVVSNLIETLKLLGSYHIGIRSVLNVNVGTGAVSATSNPTWISIEAITEKIVLSGVSWAPGDLISLYINGGMIHG